MHAKRKADVIVLAGIPDAAAALWLAAMQRAILLERGRRVRHGVILAALLLAACATSLAQAQSFPTPEQKEAIALAAAGAAAKREGTHLALRLTSGKVKRYDDKACDVQHDCVAYRLERYVRRANLFVVQIGYYEGDDYLIVDGASGTEAFWMQGRTSHRPASAPLNSFTAPKAMTAMDPPSEFGAEAANGFALNGRAPATPIPTSS